MDNLWPKIDLSGNTINSPLQILKVQAKFLGEMTKNVVIGEITKSESIPLGVTKAERLINGIERAQSKINYDFIFRFDIVAPALGNYRYNLFTMIYPITFYPLYIYLDGDIAKEITSGQKQGIKQIKLNNETQLIQVLRKVFNATKTKNIILALTSQSQL